MTDNEEKPTPKWRPLTRYPIPLDDCIARVEVPRDLTLAEAERIFRVLKSLVKP